MLLLENVPVQQHFSLTSPRRKSSGTVPSGGYHTAAAGRRHLPAPAPPAHSLARTASGQSRSLDTHWRISPKFYFQDDVLCWGVTAPQSKIYCFEYAKNIISLQRVGGYWDLDYRIGAVFTSTAS
jgi:hypothetical protein